MRGGGGSDCLRLGCRIVFMFMLYIHISEPDRARTTHKIFFLKASEGLLRLLTWSTQQPEVVKLHPYLDKPSTCNESSQVFECIEVKMNYQYQYIYPQLLHRHTMIFTNLNEHDTRSFPREPMYAVG